MSTEIWVPPGSLGDSVAEDVATEAKRIAAWARKWPKPGEPKLTAKDLVDAVLLQARQHLWDRSKAEAILSLAAKELGFASDKAAKRPVEQPTKARRLKDLPVQCLHRWRDPEARFLTCIACGIIVERTIEPQDGVRPTRVSRSTPEAREAITKLPPEEKPTP